MGHKVSTMLRPWRAWGYGFAAAGCLVLALLLRPRSPQDAPANPTEKPVGIPRSATAGAVSAPAPEVVPPQPSETVKALGRMHAQNPVYIARQKALDAQVAQGDAGVEALKAKCLARPKDDAVVVDAVVVLKRIGTPAATAALTEIRQKCPVAETAWTMLQSSH